MNSPGIGIGIIPRTSGTSVSVVTATVATGIGFTSFTANWNSFSGAQYYLLDVSTSSSFTTFVYQDQVVLAPTTSYVVIGLTENTTYYYRVRASTDAALLLDLYPSAAAAFSLRKLRAAYTGSAIRVRRSSDNAEQNIGFDANGNLDTSSLTSFCGSGNGFVTTWYDQSGNGLNVTSTLAISQPQIVNAGSVILENSQPSIKFDGVNDYFSGGNILSVGSNPIVSFIVGKATTNINAFYAKSLLGTAPSRYAFFRENGTLSLIQNSSNTIENLSTTEYSIRKLYNQQYIPNSTHKIFVNNVEMVSGVSTTIGSSSFTFLIGIYNNNLGGIGTVLPLNGQMQELVIYLSNQSSNLSAINTNINDFYSIY
jgi:hypothetical protein